ncbi:type I restriction-modification system specificity subunit [Ligilactobacillus salivarius SMXD51]|uniref:Type I restriction-modification system specificity subunit n=2 Tax=Ligilactobacillus salivarius TaxID=1624 RepID=H7FYH4_9LACO|nr:type I restriction-modification system specificity subunit [Ligilactobacillus salivarius SMXD51]
MIEFKIKENVMDNKKNGIPKLRFPGFTGAWEQRKFSEILAKSDGLRRGPFGSALKKEFFISSSEYTVYEQNNAIYNTWKTRYFITPEKFQELHKFQLVPGDFILSGAGTIGRIAQVPANITKGVFNQALIRIRINPEWMDKKFFLIWMQSENMQRKLTQANPGSAMTNLVPMSEIKKWEIIIPSKAEQNKIGEFIQKLNSLIALHQRKLEHLQEQKKGLLQKMFPKNGETVPEVRFPGFTDAWEQRKLGEVVERFDNLRIPVTSSKREKGITPYYGANGIQDYVQGYTHDGEFVLVAEDGANDLQNYPVHYVNGKVWVNNHAHVLQGKNKMVDNLFLVNAIKQIKIETYLVGGSRAKLNADVMMKLPIKVPTFNEQQKIGEYFSKFDTLITLHQRKLDHLELMKKGLLQQMFV